MLVVGITGTLGAGKGEIVAYLTTNRAFTHYSVRGYLIHEIRRRGMPLNRDSMVEVANELRAHNSPSFIVEQLFDQAVGCGRHSVIESMRTLGEVEALRRRVVVEKIGGFCLLAVDADPQVRFARIQARASETDKVSFQQFLDNERREMRSEDPAKQNIAACMAVADYVLCNDGTQEELHRQVDCILGQLHDPSCVQAV